MSDELTPDELAELKRQYAKLYTHPIARLIADHERLLAVLADNPTQADMDAAQFQINRLAGLLKQSYRDHDSVDEDCWYSCPKADDYCGDKPRDVCRCGADEWNAKLDSALAALEPGENSPQPPESA